MSAWIEIYELVQRERQTEVALLVSAWIEIKVLDWIPKLEAVALLVSAWIEIKKPINYKE